MLHQDIQIGDTGKARLIYEFGRGTERDLKQALYGHEQAAEQGMYPDLDDKILRLQENYAEIIASNF